MQKPIIYSMILLMLLSLISALFPEEIHFGVGSWAEDVYGNHRVVIHVDSKSDAVWLHVPWRRRDYHPEKKNIILIDAQTEKRIENICRVNINREFGDIVFQPVSVPGDYYLYYMPYEMTGSKNYPTVIYPEPEEAADTEWLKKNSLDKKNNYFQKLSNFPKARVLEIQTIDEFNSFYPMEVIATADETEELLNKHAGSRFLLFPEDRKYPIKMTDDLPLRWIKKGPQESFVGTAARGEFYAYQIGVYACKNNIPDIDISFKELMCLQTGTLIPSSASRCFNKGGIDWIGKPFTKIYSVDKGKILPLWCGVQIPEEVLPGEYKGEVTITPSGMEPKKLSIILEIKDEIIEDAGDNEPWRHSRLRWLDSEIALDDGIVGPFIPMKVNGSTVSCLGRNVSIAKSGLPESIQSFFSPEVTDFREKAIEILVSPMELKIETIDNKVLPWKSDGIRIVKNNEGAVVWESKNTAGPLVMICRAQMEFDGSIEFLVNLHARETINVNDIRLEIPISKEVAKYMMGMGVKGGIRPAEFHWKWDPKKNQDSVWIGDVNAGIQCSFRDENYSRPLNTNFYHSKPLIMPRSWCNDGKGGCAIIDFDELTVLISAYSGNRTIKAGEELNYNFNMLLTPFKCLDTEHQWNIRFYHHFSPVEEIAKTGANTINVHHANEINPYINYPFLRPKEMKAYIDGAHAKGMKVKIYYTVRELSNRAPELFALRTLGDEIFSYGPGGGFSWLQEHLVSNYITGWFVPKLKDAAIINSGVSRWHNYYLEGLNWLVRNVGIDGLYIDDVAFDRNIMKRVRKILDRGREGALIDLHSANQFNPRDGFANSANLYLEHFPYLNRLWFGEYFDYDSPPDFWLIEISGIPFGLMGEMLQDGGNPWRGMLYGMTARFPWSGNPTHLWKAWDGFGIEESKMFGYWSPSTPVKIDNNDILATAYVKKGSTLISIASWAKKRVSVHIKIDWNVLGITPEKAQFYAPFIKDFQDQATFVPTDSIPVDPGKGWLLIVSEKE
ncbi:MAG: hypothetical protein IBX60_02215 [Candidatus Aminicenantes bacterium]|nr:hypothetical protein [Candidatus Aminicenantes bacterium]